MPIYEYVCTNCKRRCEVLQKLSDPLLTECRVCGGKLRKIISPPAIQFKGSGWYITDYAKKSSPGSNGARKNGSPGAPHESCKDADTTEKKKPAPAPTKD